ncbi:MAG: SprT-like domain-containing protein [Bacteroidales bacterium]|nr:SprT-like domain-containing protein [Bacteroidales bacterium]
MKATKEYVEQKFGEYNQLMFDGQLPPLPIELGHARGYLGKLCYKKKRNFWGRTTCFDFKMRINAALDMSESLLEDTIIHEMIHYYIGYKKLKDTSPHGQLFRAMMKDINTRFDRHITISVKLGNQR